jgi:hypothetical protein
MEEFQTDLQEIRQLTEKVQQISFLLKEMHQNTESEQVILNLLSYATLLQKKQLQLETKYNIKTTQVKKTPAKPRFNSLDLFAQQKAQELL